MGKVKQSPADNLDMLKDLYDRGFMPREEYESRRVSILNEPIVWATEPCIEYTAPPVAFNFPQRGESMGMLSFNLLRQEILFPNQNLAQKKLASFFLAHFPSQICFANVILIWH